MFPHKITPIEENLNRELMDDFKGEKYGFVQVGTKKWCLPAIYEKFAEKFYTFPLRPDDIWLVTFPRSGTTVCQEMIWLLNNNLDFAKAAETPMDARFPFFEFSILHSDRFQEEIIKLNNNNPEVLEKFIHFKTPAYERELPSPRHYKTHLPFSLLPPDLTNTCKTIYVARNPKDVAVSYYHHNRLLKCHDFNNDFQKYWNYFKENLAFYIMIKIGLVHQNINFKKCIHSEKSFYVLVLYAPYWEHIKEGWESRNNPNVLFLFYEDLNTSMGAVIRKVADFLGKSIEDDEATKLTNHLQIDNFRKLMAPKGKKIEGVINEGEQGFIRTGQIGKNIEFDAELNRFADQWVKSNLITTDIKFPVLV